MKKLPPGVTTYTLKKIYTVSFDGFEYMLVDDKDFTNYMSPDFIKRYFKKFPYFTYGK